MKPTEPLLVLLLISSAVHTQESNISKESTDPPPTQIQLLQPHLGRDPIPKKPSIDGNWCALVCNANDTWELVSIRVKLIKDPKSQEELSLEIKGVPAGKEPIILLRGLSNPTPRALKTLTDFSNYPTNNSGFTQIRPPYNKHFNSVYFSLLTEPLGKIHDEVYLNYQVVYKQGKKRQILFKNKSGCPECCWDIRWCGDLDGDGLPDFLIGHSPMYLSFEYRLYLSSFGTGGNPLGLAGQLHVTTD